MTDDECMAATLMLNLPKPDEFDGMYYPVQIHPSNSSPKYKEFMFEKINVYARNTDPPTKIWTLKYIKEYE